MRNMNQKQMFTLILSKLAIFLFCVGFVAIYSPMIAYENRIVPIVLLIALLISLGSRFEMKAKYVVWGIPLLFLGVGVLAQLSQLNPYLGFVINIFAMLLILFTAGADQSKSLFLAFGMGYLMFQNAPVTGAVLTERLVHLFAFGLILGGLYYLKHRKDESAGTPWLLLKREWKKEGQKYRYIRLALCIGITTLVCELLKFPQVMWINLAVFSLNNPFAEDLEERKRYRIPATIFGCVLFFLAFELLVPMKYQSILVLVAGFSAMFINSYFMRTMYNSFCALVSSAMVFTTIDGITLRILANLVGVCFVLCLTYVMERVVLKKMKEKKGSYIEA